MTKKRKKMKNKIQQSRIRTTILLAVFFCLAIADSLMAAGKIRIAATTSTFASIAKEIAGERAEIHFIAPPNRDIHFITPNPRDIAKMRKADVFIHGGLDLEIWRDPLLDAVGRREFMHGGEREIDVSHEVKFLEVPDELSRLEGDIHAHGNPHYWMDPANGKIIADNIAEGLARLYPDDADFFLKNAENFKARLDAKVKEWEAGMAPYRGKEVIAYHNCWPYLMQWFGLQMAGFLEPKPGIPPTARHFKELSRLMQEKKVKVIIRETFQEKKTPEKLSKETGASVITLTQEAAEAGGDYISMLDANIAKLEAALKK